MAHEQSLELSSPADLAMAAYAPGVLDGPFAHGQATDLAAAEAGAFHAQGLGHAPLHAVVSTSLPPKDASMAVAKAALAGMAMDVPLAAAPDEAQKAAQREAARAQARERKRKSRMNPAVREREKARDRMYKMRARQALKGDKLEAYRKKDRERKRLKRLEKSRQDVEATGTGMGAAAEPLQPEPVPVEGDEPAGDENGAPIIMEPAPEMNAAALANAAANQAAAALEHGKRSILVLHPPADETPHGASTVASTEI